MRNREYVRFRSTLACLGLGILLLAITNVSAQVGASSSASARTRYLADAGYMPTSREVAVEEMINYHRHKLPLPKVGEAVAMDTRWGNNEASWSQPNAVLQIGFTTANANDRTDLRPLNLVLVIDKSGSMAEADKMSRVKQALLQLERKLRPTDLVGIVVFDSTAQVALGSQALGNGTMFRETINGLYPGSSTNLNAGLMLGYQEALRNYRKGSTNRVIMLTDGIANTGVTDPRQIAQASQINNDKGVDLTTIGLGLDLDKDLLRTLAKSGHGLFHFVADAQDIQKVFVDEVQSLVSPVARNVRLSIDYDRGLKLNRVFGYEPRMGSDSIYIDLEDMNQGLTEIALMEFRLENEKRQGQPYVVNITLTYFDIARNRDVVLRDSVSLTSVNHRQPAMLVDTEVRKNYTIALLAQAIKDMAVAWEGQQYARAESIINTAVSGARETYPNLDDADIKYNLNIAENYQAGLRRYNQSRRENPPDR